MNTLLSTVKIKKNSSIRLGNIIRQLCWSPSGNQLASLLESNEIAVARAFEDGGVKKVALLKNADLIAWGGNDSRLFVAYADGEVGYLNTEDLKFGDTHSAQRRRFIYL